VEAGEIESPSAIAFRPAFMCVSRCLPRRAARPRNEQSASWLVRAVQPLTPGLSRRHPLVLVAASVESRCYPSDAWRLSLSESPRRVDYATASAGLSTIEKLPPLTSASNASTAANESLPFEKVPTFYVASRRPRHKANPSTITSNAFRPHNLLPFARLFTKHFF
jgi:hypothetical protein